MKPRAHARVTQIDCLPHAPHHSAVASVGRMGQNVHIAPAHARVRMVQTIRPMCPTTGSALRAKILGDSQRQLARAGDR
jgi:hypothetical protein